MDAGEGPGDPRGAAEGLPGADFVYVDGFHDPVVRGRAGAAVLPGRRGLGP